MKTHKAKPSKIQHKDTKFEQERAASLDYDVQRKGGTPSPPPKPKSKEGKSGTKKSG
jgi:hypothetical protein